MNLPTLDDARRLAEWAPPMGIVSIYLRLDPGDRGGGWRTELHNGLSAVLDADGLDHRGAAALRATAERIGERFTNHERGLPRGEVGFVEVATKPGPERWWSTHLSPASTVTAALDQRPLVAPLVCLLERGTPRGVALLSAERVRLLAWAPGHLEELSSWERDQFDERLAENRHRFLGECGRLAARAAAEHGWRQLLLFGAAEYRRELRQGLPASELAVEAGDADLISEPSGRLEEPIAGAVEELDAERDRELAERALDEARGGSRGTAGRQETEAALAEARVECLLLDAARSDAAEALVRSALESGAGIAAVSGEAAGLLEPVEGVAALLRY